jgi:UDP:flavonoid glycosyltransferase YjiC (YdhE family)
VLSDPVYYGSEVVSHGHVVLPAPPVKRLLEINSLTNSYGNLLAVFGFGRKRHLELVLKAWDQLLALLSPILVVAENSPFVCLAARDRIPVFVVGSGFSVPPAEYPAFPPLTGESKPEANQAAIREIVNNVLEQRRARSIDKVPELLAGEGRAVFSLPQLDPYHAYRTERLLNPCIDFKGPLPAHDTPSIFLAAPSNLPNLVGVVRALEQTGAAVSGYLAGPATVGVTLLNQIGAHVFATRPLLNAVLSQSAAVMAVSADLALSAYVAGRPQLIIAQDLETTVMASELEKRRTAIVLETTAPHKISNALKELLHDPSYAQSAAEEARRLQTRVVWQNSAEIAARECLEIMR